MKTLGRYLVEALEAFGVRDIFGIPGVHNLELYRPLAGSTLRHITGRHEQGLGFMADGYARVSGRPGVCFTISGPGVSNITTALGQAYADSIPMLVIASQNRRAEAGSGRGFLHEVRNQKALVDPVTAMSFTIGSAAELADALMQTFDLFVSARPRPVYIEVPLDVIASDANNLQLPAPARACPPVPNAADLEAAAALLRAATRAIIIVGGGALRAVNEVRMLVERLGAPVVMTINGRGILPAQHPLAISMSPSLEPVRALIAQADVTLAVGTEIGPTDFDMYSVKEFVPPPNLIRIDIDKEQLTRNAIPRIGLCGDATLTLQRLLSYDLGTGNHSIGRDAADYARAAAGAALSPLMRRYIDILELIRDALPTAILVGDSTQLVYAGNLGFAASTAGSWFNAATGYGTLGYALPASTGAGLAAPERPIVCLIGDGGLQFTLGELAVLRDVNAWTAIIVWNNYGYEEIRLSMTAAGFEPTAVDVRPPDFGHLATAYDLNYQLVSNSELLQQALAQFSQQRQSVLLELVAPSYNI
jgi:acetolactate synthase I/II/III large subunit